MMPVSPAAQGAELFDEAVGVVLVPEVEPDQADPALLHVSAPAECHAFVVAAGAQLFPNVSTEIPGVKDKARLALSQALMAEVCEADAAIVGTVIARTPLGSSLDLSEHEAARRDRVTLSVETVLSGVVGETVSVVMYAGEPTADIDSAPDVGTRVLARLRSSVGGWRLTVTDPIWRIDNGTIRGLAPLSVDLEDLVQAVQQAQENLP